MFVVYTVSYIYCNLFDSFVLMDNTWVLGEGFHGLLETPFRNIKGMQQLILKQLPIACIALMKPLIEMSAFTRARFSLRWCPCASCIWLLHPAPTNLCQRWY